MFSSCKKLLNSPKDVVKDSVHKVKGGNPKKVLSNDGLDGIVSSFASMEVSNQLKQVFKIIDANGDGKISSMELGEVLSCLGHEKEAAVKEAEGMVNVVDYNGDGFIDLEEFMEVVGENINRDDSLLEAFHVFDTDKNGFISARELLNVFHSLGYDKCTLKDCKLMIRGVDVDGDGLVNYDEFRRMMTGSR